MTGGASLLEVEDLAVAPTGAGEPLLTGVSLRLRRGECVALVGPSGSGKTTLLRTLAGTLPPVGGVMRLEGQTLAPSGRPRQIRARIGLVTQKHDLIDSLRVDKNVLAGSLGRISTLHALRLLLWTAPGEMARAEKALANVGLEGMARRRTSRLSGGEQQRVAIARALIQSPVLLLADEPIASLDPTTAGEVLALLTDFARSSGSGLICSLHQPDLAHRFCDRTMVLRGGSLIERTRVPEPA